jgi:hypothetical protein
VFATKHGNSHSTFLLYFKAKHLSWNFTFLGASFNVKDLLSRNSALPLDAVIVGALPLDARLPMLKT